MRERGSGSLFQDSYRDKQTGQKVKCGTWTMKLWVNGKPLKRSSGTSSYRRALKKLEQWKAEVSLGTYVSGADKTNFDEGAMLLTNEYKANGRRSADRVEDAIGHLRAFFGGYWRMRAIMTDRVLAYVRHRQEQGRRKRDHQSRTERPQADVPAGREGREGRPTSPHRHAPGGQRPEGLLRARPVRRVLAHLPDYLQPVFTTADVTGWRVKSEILTRQKSHVDFTAG
jgi:hypothetical protein